MYFVLVNRLTEHKNYNNNQIRPGNYDYVVNTETDNSFVSNSVSYYILYTENKTLYIPIILQIQLSILTEVIKHSQVQ